MVALIAILVEWLPWIATLLVLTVKYIAAGIAVWYALKVVLSIISNWHKPAGWTQAGWVVYNLVKGALNIAGQLLSELAPALEGLVAAYVNSASSFGPAIGNTISAPVGEFAQTTINETINTLLAQGESTTTNAIDAAAAAMQKAFAKGAESAAVTAAFEAVFPEKLNTLNVAGPMIAQLSGFGEVAGQIRTPLYRTAFGASAEYAFNAAFSPYYPSLQQAGQWYARGLLSDSDLNTIYSFSGIKAPYFNAFEQGSYRAVPPFLFSSLLANEAFPAAQVQSALQYNGFRPQDVSFLVTALQWKSTETVRQAYLNAIVRSVELGVATPADLASALQNANYSQEAINWVQLTAAEIKLQQLTELYRKSISEGYKYGTISDANYVTNLEAIGIDAADAQAHYAVDSITKQGKADAQAAREALSLAKRQTSAAMKAALAEYARGTIDAAALEAALLAAGVDPTIATYAVVVAEQRKLGPQVLVYGVELGRQAAMLLREQVTAIGQQVHAGLMPIDTASSVLSTLGLPAANIEALIADWKATITPAADVGVREPVVG